MVVNKELSLSTYQEQHSGMPDEASAGGEDANAVALRRSYTKKEQDRLLVQSGAGHSDAVCHPELTNPVAGLVNPPRLTNLARVVSGR